MLTAEMLGSSSVAVASRGHEIMLISAILYIILFGISALLVFTRIRLRCSFEVDGILVLLAMLPTSLYFVATLLTNNDFEWNRHQADIPQSTLENGFKMVFAAEIVYTIALTMAKLSLMMLVRRIMSSASSFWRGLTVFTTILLGIQGVISCFLVIFQRGTPQNFWEARTLTSTSSRLLAAGILHTITNILVFLLPIPSVLSFQLSRRQKVILFLIFFLGISSTVAGVTRTYFLSRSSQQHVEDFTWSYYPVWISSALELYLGMLCALLPPSNLFFTTYAPSIFGPPISISSLSENDNTKHSHDLYARSQTPHRKQSIFSSRSTSANSFSSGGEEEFLGLDQIEKMGVTISTVESRSGGMGEEGIQDGDGEEFILIVQQTVVQVSRAE